MDIITEIAITLFIILFSIVFFSLLAVVLFIVLLGGIAAELTSYVLDFIRERKRVITSTSFKPVLNTLEEFYLKERTPLRFHL